MLATLFYFFLALLLLVTVHEFGHFLVARWCGVKVLRFSFGFGKVLFSRRDKKGTEYAFSLFPLGGYVKMLDETEGEVAESEKHLAFNRQSLAVRIAVVIAGPLFNLIFAVFLLWLVAVIGITSLAPMISGVKPDSIAARAGIKPGQEIIAVNGDEVRSWHDFQYAMMSYIGSEETITLLLKSMKGKEEQTLALPLNHWSLDPKNPDLLDSIGIVPYVPQIPPVVGTIMPDSPAARAGFINKDLIKKINGKPITDWMELVDFVRSHPDQKIALEVERHQKLITIEVLIASKEMDGKKIGYIGIQAEKVDIPADWLRIQRSSPLAAIGLAFKETTHLTGATLTLMGRLVTGQLGLNNLSGPVGIAQGAGDSARGGFVYYLSFLALISISLGVLNILPIPMLDGGHLLYYLLELISGKPLSEEFKSVGVYIGLFFLGAVMVIAMSNDISRLMG